MDRAFNVDLTQTLQRQGGSSAVPQQPFQGLTLRRFDAHAGVERKAATVVAIRHSPFAIVAASSGSGTPRRVGARRRRW